VEDKLVQDMEPIPQTLKEVDLLGRIRASGSTNLKDGVDVLDREIDRGKNRKDASHTGIYLILQQPFYKSSSRKSYYFKELHP